MTSFQTYVDRSEVGVHFPVFTPMLKGVRKRSFTVATSV
jgi:hypothetical protein